MATKVAGATTTYGYDFEQRPCPKAGRPARSSCGQGRLASVTTGANTTSFAYDFDGVRRRVSGSGETDRYFVFDGSTALAEYATAGGALLNCYTTGATGLAGEHTAAGDYMYHGDVLGTTRLMTDTTVTLQQKYTQDAFGIETATSGSVSTAHRYVGGQGYYQNTSVALQTLGIRQYDPRLGRFTTRDPSGPVDGPNNFAYVGGNPVVRVDPTGRWVLLAVLCIGACVVTAACRYFTDACFQGSPPRQQVIDCLKEYCKLEPVACAICLPSLLVCVFCLWTLSVVAAIRIAPAVPQVVSAIGKALRWLRRLAVE